MFSAFLAKQEANDVVTMFTRSEPVQFYLSFILMDKMCSDIPYTYDCLREKN